MVFQFLGLKKRPLETVEGTLLYAVWLDPGLFRDPQGRSPTSFLTTLSQVVSVFASLNASRIRIPISTVFQVVVLIYWGEITDERARID
jgi:hypothetical protein